MPFKGYLSPVQITTLVTKAVDSDLIQINRTLLLQGIFKTFALALPKDDNDLTQFNLDLVKLNETERLADGQVPVVQFLQNAANQLRLRGRPEADDFEQAANIIGNRVHGLPPLPSTSTLREIEKKEAIVGVDDMVDFAFLAGGTSVGRSVARILVPRFENGAQVLATSGAPWRMTGTAWMIAPTLMLTNHHVINARNSDEAAASEADFMQQGKNAALEFDFDAQGSAVTSVSAATVEVASAELDYAVLRLASNPGRAALRFHPLKVTFTPATYLPVNIVQHPRGLPKRIAFRNNLITGADADTVRYFTDTDFGSSGSPVCDDNWRVLALHRGAEFVKGVMFQGKSTAFVNFGSQIQAVLSHIQAHKAALHAEVLEGQEIK
jgi:endonuclease G, mitochondrial